MVTTRSRRGFTLVELLVVIAIIGILIGLLLPAINAAREAGRRASCTNKVKQLGLGLQNYASTFQSLPAGAPLNTNKSVGGKGAYSWLVKILPFMEYDNLYKTLDRQGDPEAAAAGTPMGLADQTSIKEFVCPSNANQLFLAPTASPPTGALTNYKGVAATTVNSLNLVTGSGAAPYGTSSLHPDGVMIPSTNGVRFADIPDGTSHTIATLETIDDTYSRWLVGKDCLMVGFPKGATGLPSGPKPTAPYTYFSPTGYNGDLGDSSPVSTSAMKDFMMYDFSPQGTNNGANEVPTWSKATAYGPSSAHPAVCMGGMVDGSVQSVSKRLDPAAFFFLITKNGSDPFYIGQ